LKGTVTNFSPWGMTSIHDAIASASRSMDSRATKRRALVVLTDGFDTASKLDAAEVSRIASSIDLPVYVLAVVPSIDDPRNQEGGNRALNGDLADLARWTGGAAVHRDEHAGSQQRRARAGWRAAGAVPDCTRARGEARVALGRGTRHTEETAPCRRAGDMSRGLAGPSVNSESYSGR
jgi:hypothetical protein